MISVHHEVPASTFWAAGLGVLVTLATLLELVRCERRARSSGKRQQLARALDPLPTPGADSRPYLLQLLPEVLGLAACLGLAGFLLTRGSDSLEASATQEDKELWQSIRADWPLLLTADSLIGLAALSRALLFTSAVLRAEDSSASSMGGFPTAFLLLAAMTRCALLTLSPPDVYGLDGPLGGSLYACLEVAGLLLLLLFGGLQVYRAERAALLPPLVTLALSASFVVIACKNRLAIAEQQQWYLDTLFSLNQLMELAAAVTFLANTVRTSSEQGKSAFTVFAHTLLPFQQALPAYFLVAAWGGAPLTEVPALVGAGRPFELLQLAGAAQVGAYALALVHFGFRCGDEEIEQNGLVEV